jgi:hypothetical protein
MFWKEFNPDVDDVTAEFIKPLVMLHLEKDICHCSFEHDGMIMYKNCDLSMVPLAVLPQTAKEQSAILKDKEVYDEVNVWMEARWFGPGASTCSQRKCHAISHHL